MGIDTTMTKKLGNHSSAGWTGTAAGTTFKKTLVNKPVGWFWRITTFPPVFLQCRRCLQTGFFRAEEGSPIYYAEADGAVLKGGIHEIDGAPYWFYEDGALHTGWQTVDGKRYFYDPETGAITFGWINWNNRNYYISEEKGKYTGLEQVDGEYYPFSEENGVIQEGMQKMPDGTTRYYYNNGAFHRGWFYQNNQTYYFDEKMVLWSLVGKALVVPPIIFRKTVLQRLAG